MMKLNRRNLAKNKNGLFLTAVIIIITLMVSDILWLVLIVVQNNFLDTWLNPSWSNHSSNTHEVVLADMLRNQGAIVIVAINIGLVVLLIIAAWKRETQDEPLGGQM
jgi:hypothetical protein